METMENKGVLLAITSWFTTGCVFVTEHATKSNASFLLSCMVNLSILIYYIRKNKKLK